MARRFRGKRRAGKKNRAIPISIVAPLAMPAIQYVIPKAIAGDFKGAMSSLALEYAGIDANNKFHFNQVAEVAVPLLVGVVVHKAANRFGINKYARKASMGYLEF